MKTDKIEEAFEKWAARQSSEAMSGDEIARRSWQAAVVWKELQDLACVEAVRISSDLIEDAYDSACTDTCDEITARITLRSGIDIMWKRLEDEQPDIDQRCWVSDGEEVWLDMYMPRYRDWDKLHVLFWQPATLPALPSRD